ncbi:unnamed protein product [Cyprideis torosa]|uniref:Uncharacterized protein n=1 Tax=Cyprideis torosa TaxID=163714 RepID=A0A7R8WAL0_9CRUS|nr:unnamed protein product [Cyprideis torosa]CAG0891116.1 unnamed protein product [Cyprideis torosa]
MTKNNSLPIQHCTGQATVTQGHKMGLVIAAFLLSTSGLLYGLTVSYTSVAVPSWTNDPSVPFNLTLDDVSLHAPHSELPRALIWLYEGLWQQRFLKNLLCNGKKHQVMDIHFEVTMQIEAFEVFLRYLRSINELARCLLPSIQIGSIINIGSMTGSLITGMIIGYLGAKKVVILSTIPYIAAWMMCRYPSSIGMLLFGRFLSGFSVDIKALSSMMYLSDFVSKQLRGRLQTMTMVLLNVGSIVTYALGMFMEWDQIALFNMIIPIPLALACYYFPEPPTQLLERGAESSAVTSLQWYRGNVSQSVLQEDINERKAALERKRRRDTGALKDLLSIIYIKPMLICIACILLRQLSGIYCILAFTVDIFQMTGTSINPYVASIIMSSLQLVSQLFSASLTDKFGAKRFVVASGFICAICQMTFGIFFYLKTIDEYAPSMENLGIIPLVSLIVLMIGYGLGMYNITYSLTLEVLPAKIRTPGIAICAFINSGSCFLVVLNFYTMVESPLKMHGTFWLYGISCLLFCIIYAKFIPESRGLTLAEIERKMSESALEKMSRKRSTVLVLPNISSTIPLVSTEISLQLSKKDGDAGGLWFQSEVKPSMMELPSMPPLPTAL